MATPDEVQAAETAEQANRGQIIVTFLLDDTLQARYSDMKPWKLWAAGELLKHLGDQMMMQAQMEQMQRVQQETEARQMLLRSISQNPGGLRGS
jgi:hypothetical protein